MTNKLQKIRQACIDANPSILDLSFGCEIRDITDGSTYKLIYNVGNHYLKLTSWSGDDLNTFNTDESWNGKTEIIGRPIRLSDILIAFRDVWIMPTTKKDQGFRYLGLGLGNPGISWNLLKDDLSLQSEDTIDFIYNLIENK